MSRPRYMVSTELVSAVVVAGSVLYGFMIAYYAIGLVLAEQEKLRIHTQLSSPAKMDMTKEEHDQDMLKAKEQWLNVLARAASGNMFLLGCTLFAVPTILLGIISLGGFDFLGLLAVILFLVFLFVVAAGMAGVGYQGIQQNVREFQEKSGTPAKLMDVSMRGIGKS